MKYPIPKAMPSLFRLTMRTGSAALFRAIWANGLASLCSLTLVALLALALAQGPMVNMLCVAAIPVLYLLRAALAAYGEYHAAEAGARLRIHVRHRLYQHLLQLGPVALTRFESGALSTALIEQVEALEGYAARFMPALFGLLGSVMVLAALWPLSLTVVGILCLSTLALPLLMALSGILAKKATQQQATALQRMAGLFHDRMQSLTLLHTMGAVESTLQRLTTAADDFRTRTMKVLRVAFLSSAGFELAFVAALVFSILHVWHNLNVTMPVGTALFILLLVPEFFAPLRALLATYHDRMNAVTAHGEISRLLGEPISINNHNHRAPEIPEKPSLEFRHVYFSYSEDRTPVLIDLSFKAKGGEWLAISGPSGAGKSTIIHLLLGFIHPNEGEILLADHELQKINDDARCEFFSWMGQRSHLFFGTLEDNIRLARPSATAAEIQAAVHAAQLDDLVARLPDGLNTVIGEQGFGLSGGEAQRVALARAFLHRTPVLLLDEPTAGLDRETAQALLDTIKVLAQTRTVLMVTHDPLALKAATRVLRFAAGELKEGF